MIMIRSVDYYQNIVSNFIQEDLNQTKDLCQHEVNTLCYLKEIYGKVKSEFDITVDDIDVLRYLNKMINQTQKNLYYYHLSDTKVS